MSCLHTHCSASLSNSVNHDRVVGKWSRPRSIRKRSIRKWNEGARRLIGVVSQRQQRWCHSRRTVGLAAHVLAAAREVPCSIADLVVLFSLLRRERLPTSTKQCSSRSAQQKVPSPSIWTKARQAQMPGLSALFLRPRAGCLGAGSAFAAGSATASPRAGIGVRSKSIASTSGLQARRTENHALTDSRSS